MAGLDVKQPMDNDSGHISSEDLSAFHADPKSLDGTTVDRIRDHLKQCPDCASDFEFMVNLETSLREQVAKRPAEAGAQVGFGNFFRALILKPAFAVPLAAALVFLAVWWFRSGTPSRPLQTAGILLKELRRSGGEATTVLRSGDTKALRLDIPEYTLSEMNYSVTISNQSQGRPLAVDVRLGLGDKGLVHAEFDPRSLTDGDYLLSLLEISKAVPPDTTVSVFPFRLATQDGGR